MSMTGKRRKATALLVVFFVLFSALYLSMGMENGGTESGSAASVVTWRSERFSVTEQVNVEELSGVRSLMLRLFPGMTPCGGEGERNAYRYAGVFVCALFSPEASFYPHDREAGGGLYFPERGSDPLYTQAGRTEG